MLERLCIWEFGNVDGYDNGFEVKSEFERFIVLLLKF